jgi:hypothetical protein
LFAPVVSPRSTREQRISDFFTNEFARPSLLLHTLAPSAEPLATWQPRLLLRMSPVAAPTRAPATIAWPLMPRCRAPVGTPTRGPDDDCQAARAQWPSPSGRAAHAREEVRDALLEPAHASWRGKSGFLTRWSPPVLGEARISYFFLTSSDLIPLWSRKKDASPIYCFRKQVFEKKTTHKAIGENVPNAALIWACFERVPGLWHIPIIFCVSYLLFIIFEYSISFIYYIIYIIYIYIYT